MSLKSKLKKRKPNHADLPFCLERPLVEQYRVLSNKVAVEKGNRDGAYAKPKSLAGAEAELKALEKQIEEATVTLRFHSVGWGRYNEILAEHPPRDGHTEEYNSSTFFIALARETAEEVTSNGSTVPIHDDEWEDFVEGLTDGEHDYLAQALIALNRSHLTVNPIPLV